MKTYEPRRNNACPNGLHPDYDPAKDPSQNECTCPWLIIQSSTPVQHLTSWNRRETENVIREMDRGYFDPPGYPKRTGSMFLSPAMQRLLDVAEKEPVAAALTLLAGSGSGLPPFDAIAWDAEDAVLSLRSGAAGGWRRLWLGHTNVETVTDQSKTPGGVAPVLLWAEHPDTAEETGLPQLHKPGTWVKHMEAMPRQEWTDYFAEDLASTTEALAEIASETDVEPPQDYFAEDITGTAPLVFEVPADQLGEMRAGNPMFDELMQRATDENAGGLVFIPAELASGGAISQDVVALVGEDGRVSGFDAVHEGMTTLPRLEDVPLPRRVPQLPSDMAQDGHGDYCTCDLNLRYTCPACRAAQADACICDIRGSGPDTYACPEHPAKPCSLRCTSYVHVTYTDDAKTEGVFRCEKNALHDGDHLGEGSTWPDGATHLTGVAPTRATCIRCGFVALDDVSLLAWNSPHGDETHAACGGAVTLHEMPATDVV